MMKEKFLIVGGGLSGVAIGYHLIQKGMDVTLIDDQNNQSSIVAAGMINPLVFRRMTKSWRVDDFIPYCEVFYSSLEKQAERSFFHPITIRRFFSSQQEKDFWTTKQVLPEFSPYMEMLTERDLNFNDEGILNEFGSGKVKKSFWIDTNQFLNAVKEVIHTQGTLISELFDHSKYDAASTTYKGEQFSSVIFCEGYRSRFNPLFSYLPVQSTKGELMEINCPGLETTESYNRKCFVLPIGQHQFKVGATYKWNNTDPIPEENAIEDLTEKLSYLTTKDFKVTRLLGGIRPTTLDRRPIVGEHPKEKGNYIFNGLGTKGYMIAPLLAKEFCDHLIDKIPLNNEIDIQRFDQLLSITS
ncbi:MAG: FAD-binding oxidoreductase [Bacteroidetes bacterium]|nr:MAG: FAD-binding oxidoreductase [Bacteroidota bacterium]